MSEEGKAEATYPVERLLDESEDFLGHPRHVVAGALHDLGKKNATVAEAQKRVEQWLKRPAERDPAEAED